MTAGGGHPVASPAPRSGAGTIQVKKSGEKTVRKKKDTDPIFKDVRAALEEQDAVLRSKIEYLEERVLQAEARNKQDSNPVASFWGELARSQAWSN